MPQDLNDESADKLLELIAKAREEAEALVKAAKKAEAAKKRAAKATFIEYALMRTFLSNNKNR